MQLITDHALTQKTLEFSERFWKQMDELVRKMEEVLFLRFELNLEETKGLHQHVFDRVRKEMKQEAISYFSQPSLFMYRFLTVYLEKSEEVKREIFKNTGDSPRYKGYDAEADIRETRPQAEYQLQTSFESELAYWKAMEEKRYVDAKIILSAIALMRKNHELVYQIETSNWKMDLARRTGEVELFLEAIASIPADAECAVNVDDVRRHLSQLLLVRGMSEIKVKISLDGHRRLSREASPIEFLRTQIDVFSNSLLTQIANGVLSHKHMEIYEFFKLVEAATKESKIAFLKVHPFITDLVVVWKKS